MAKHYTAHAWREDGWWVSTVEEVPGLNNQTRRLDQIEQSVRDGLELFPEVDENPQQAEVTVVVEGLSAIAKEAIKRREEAQRLEQEVDELMQSAARDLVDKGLKYRDIGQILGVSLHSAQRLASA